MTAHPYENSNDSPAMVDEAWKFASSERTCMLTTWNGTTQASRPMAPQVKREEHAIYFFTKADSAKDQELEKFPSCSLAFMENAKNKYLTIIGTAAISNDRAKIKDLWSPMLKTWFESETDPTIRLLVFTPERAELWDGPNALVAAGIMLVAASTGAKLPLGRNAKIAM